MNQSVVVKLIIKDLYLYRWLMVGTIGAGLASIFMSSVDGPMAGVGQILFVTSIVVLGIFIALYGVLAERKTRSLLFVLSLPISPMQYTVAKVAGGMVAFLLPWAILFAAILALSGTAALPFTLIMMTLFLANFAVLMALGMTTGSELWAVVGIIATNTSVPVILGILGPALTGGTSGWSAPIAVLFVVEVLVAVLAVGFIFFMQSRRPDFVS